MAGKDEEAGLAPKAEPASAPHPLAAPPAAAARRLTDEQAAFVDLVASDRSPRVVCLTGGPGTGKTTCVRELVAALRARGESVALAAPSGKAARRLTEAAGTEAHTIHRLLAMQPADREAGQPVAHRVLVVDEASMIDASLAAITCRAAFGPGGMARTLALVGDADQLPPVGPGSPFADLVRAGVTPAVRLTRVQRVGEGSGLALAAQAILAGRTPEWGPEVRLVEAADADVAAVVADLAEREWRDVPLERAQALAAVKAKVGGVEEVCATFEARRGKPDDLVRGQFRAGTRVLSLRNDYDRDLRNGMLGTVEVAHAGDRPGGDTLRVAWDEGGDHTVHHGGELAALAPAWCLTVHKSQGSEWDEVAVVAARGHAFSLTRALLYVALTRARRRCWIVGTEAAVAKAVRNRRDLTRRTMLARWLARRRVEGVGGGGREA